MHRLFMAIAVAGGLASPSVARSQDRLTRPTLTFTLRQPTRHLAPNVLVIPYELANTDTVTTYISQFPGPAFDLSCQTGEFGGAFVSERGVWSTEGGLARSYFIRLAPGETLYGERALRLPPECKGRLEIRGEFDSDTTNAWGLTAAGVRFMTSATLVIERPASPRKP